MSQKTIAILASMDTKHEEVFFLKNFIQNHNMNVFLIDLSGINPNPQADVSPDDILKEICLNRKDLMGKRNEMLNALSRGICVLLPKLYQEGKFQAVMGIGGLQNSLMGCQAMQTLPIGIPKVMLSTVASGHRRFDPFIGTKDISIMFSISDIAGCNPLTELMLSNAAASVIGMLDYSGHQLETKKQMIASTLMGVTNDGICKANQLMRDAGFDVLPFHSTGTGGRAMEEMISDGYIGGVMDLCLHEITSNDVIGAGFSVGAPNRLMAAIEKEIPMVIAPGGIDFIDFYIEDYERFPLPNKDKRKIINHNNSVCHVKLQKDEILCAAKIMVDRINEAKQPVCVLLPLKGLRFDTQKGETLYDPEVDQAFIDYVKEHIKKEIPCITIDANINDVIFGEIAAREMERLLQQQKEALYVSSVTI